MRPRGPQPIRSRSGQMSHVWSTESLGSGYEHMCGFSGVDVRAWLLARSPAPVCPLWPATEVRDGMVAPPPRQKGGLATASTFVTATAMNADPLCSGSPYLPIFVGTRLPRCPSLRLGRSSCHKQPCLRICVLTLAPAVGHIGGNSIFGGVWSFVFSRPISAGPWSRTSLQGPPASGSGARWTAALVGQFCSAASLGRWGRRVRVCSP